MDNHENTNDFAKDMSLCSDRQDNPTDVNDWIEAVNTLADTEFLTELQRNTTADLSTDREAKIKLALQIEDLKHQYKRESISWVIKLHETKTRSVFDKRLRRFGEALLETVTHHFLYTQEGRTQLIRGLTSAKKIVKSIIEAA